MANDTGVRIKSARRLSEIIELLQSEGPLGATEITERLDIPKSTAHDYLSSLHGLEYVVKSDGKYDLGLRFLDHGFAARERQPIARVGAETIEQLAATTGEATWLVTEEHGKAVYLDSAQGDQAVQTHARVGTRSHLHYLASGKAMLAHMPRERVTEIVDEHGLERRTDETIESVDRLFDELETVRERGYAVNDNEAVDGVRAVGTAVVVEGEVRGAISVSGPANRMTDQRLEDGVAEQVLGAANELELKLGQA